MFNKKRIAYYISNIGNPFTLLFLFTIYSCFYLLPLIRAFKITLLITFLALVPTALFIYFNVRKGSYSNYDVSNQQQRFSLYMFSLSIIALITVCLFLNAEPPFIIGVSVSAFVLMTTSFLVNLQLKCSLHTSFAVFISIGFLPLNSYICAILLLFSIVMGWSRVILRRHTFAEVITGGVLGMAIGFLFYSYIIPFMDK